MKKSSSTAAAGERAQTESKQKVDPNGERHYTKKELIYGFPVPGTAMAPVDQKLGALAMLVGTWKGRGNTMLATPSKEGLFRAIGHPHTEEILTYNAAAPTPDRGGFNQPDISLTGLRYHHQVIDAITTEPLHEEMGFLLNIPATVNPRMPAMIVREFTIPHGNAGIMFGNATVPKGQYKFPGLYAIPFPKENFPSPKIYDTDGTGDQNKRLNEAHAGLKFLKSQVITLSTRTPNDIVNIPFLATQANTTLANITYLISIVSRDGGEPFYMLQYSQEIMLQFPAVKGGPLISWPHTAVATLYKTS